MRALLMTVGFVLATICGPTLNAAVLVFQNGLDGYRGTLDTQVFLGSPDADLSGQVNLNVDLGSKTSQVLIRFDDIIGSRPNQIPTRARILSATLTIQPVSSGATGAKLHRMLRLWYGPDSWNYWVDGVQTDDFEAVETPDADVGPVGGSPIDINVTTSLQHWVNGQTNLGWIITHHPGDSFDAFEFASSEHATASMRPKLRIEFAPLCPGDLDGDGVTDVNDLLILIGAWGNCP